MAQMKVTIEYQGTPTEVSEWMAQLPSGVSTAKHTEVEWTPEMAEKLVRRISERAREALWLIAKNAPTVHFDLVQEEMDTDGLGLGGVMASFGFAEKAGIPRPFLVDRDKREYRMDGATAAVFEDVLEKKPKRAKAK